MHIQRIIILVLAAIGFIAAFLPWASITVPFLGTVTSTGLNGDGEIQVGFITMGLYIIPVIMTLIGNKARAIRGGLLVGAIIPSVLAGLLMLLIFVGFTEEGYDIGIGTYFALAFGFIIPIVGLVLMGKKPQVEQGVS